MSKSARKTAKPAARRKTAAAKPAAKAEPGRRRGRGRPSDFRPEYCDQVEKLCKLGATDVEIADFFGKSESTINLWKLKHPEFSESVKRGKLPADFEVADAFHRRARGFEWDEQQPIKVKEVFYDANGKKTKEVERVEIVTVHKVVPPDTTAGIFWLVNRRGKAPDGNWRQRQEVTGKDGAPLGGDVNLDEVRETINSKFDRIAAQLAAAGVSQQS